MNLVGHDFSTAFETGLNSFSGREISTVKPVCKGHPWEMARCQVTVIYRVTAVHRFPLNSPGSQCIAFL